METFIYILLGGLCMLVGVIFGTFVSFFVYMKIFARVIQALPRDKMDAIVRILEATE